MSFVDELLGQPRAWMRDALCAEYPDVNFFPVRGESTTAAKAVCARCFVRRECARSVEDESVPGIWGGMSERERRQHRRADIERVVAA